MIGNVLGPLGKALNFVLKYTKKFAKFVPGWGIAISIAVEVIPLLFSFIAT